MPSLLGERVLVTGGAGFIGSHLVDLLRAQRGADVVVLDNLEPQTHPHGRPDWLPLEVEFHEGDVRSADDLARALKGVRYVFHLAGYGGFVPHVSKYMDVNATGTIRLYEALRDHGREVRKVVVASSQGIYGEGLYRDGHGHARSLRMRPIDSLERAEWEHRDPNTGELLHPDATPESQPHDSLNLYSISKYAEERSALSLGQLFRFPTCCLRYGLTYGVRQSLHNPYTGVVSIFSTQIMNGLHPTPYEDGRQTRDFVNVLDNARANLFAMEHEATEQKVYNVGTGRPTSIHSLACLLAQAFEHPELQPVYRGTFRPGDVRHLVLDRSALSSLGWDAEISLNKGLPAFVNWVRSQDHVPERFRGAERQLVASGVVRMSRAG